MIEPLAEVDTIRALDGGGYEVRYVQRDQNDPSRTTAKSVTAEKVIVSATVVRCDMLLEKCVTLKFVPLGPTHQRGGSL